MKVKVSISELRDALNVAALTLSKRKGSADNALLFIRAGKSALADALYLFSFDGIARTMVKIPAVVEEEGKTVINPNNLIGSLSKVVKDGEITLAQGDKKDKLSVTGAGRKMNFAASGELENFEALIHNMPLAQQETFTITAATFKNLIRQSAPFVEKPDQEDNANINRGDTNLLIRPVPEAYEACATEGNSLAVVRVKDVNVATQAEDLKIPIRSVLNLKGMLEKMKGQHIRVIVGKDSDGDPRALYLRTENIFYGTSLDTARFREYKAIVEMPVNHRVSLPKDHFQGVIQNAMPFTGGLKEEDALIVLYISRNRIKVTAGKGTETFEEEVEVNHELWPENQSGALRLAFDPKYLFNVARVISGDTVTVAVAANQVMAFFGSETDEMKSTYAVARYVDQMAVAQAA